MSGPRDVPPDAAAPGAAALPPTALAVLVASVLSAGIGMAVLTTAGREPEARTSTAVAA